MFKLLLPLSVQNLMIVHVCSFYKHQLCWNDKERFQRMNTINFLLCSGVKT